MEREDYLETIHKLELKHGYVRISDIAKVLDVKKPTVTQMIQRLAQENLVIYQAYRPIQLTDKGRKIGIKIAENHKVLEKFLSLIGVPPKTRDKDIHGMEHCLSEITLKKLKELNKKLTKNP